MRLFAKKLIDLLLINAKEHGLEDAIQWNWENMNKIKEKVESCGLKVVVDVAAKAEPAVLRKFSSRLS